jgi:hypothetical protein
VLTGPLKEFEGTASLFVQKIDEKAKISKNRIKEDLAMK